MVLKERLKGFIVGAVITGFLFSTSYATPITKSISATYNSIKIYVDRVLVEPKDANGNKVDPFIYNGTTYLPVRAVAEALGKPVNWDQKTNSVYIGMYNDTTPTLWFENLDFSNKQSNSGVSSVDLWDASSDKDTVGRNYTHGMIYNVNVSTWLSTEHIIDKNYKKFKGTFVTCYQSKNAPGKAYLQIYGEDKLLYTSTMMKSGSKPIDFDVDITGVTELTVKISNQDGAITNSYGIVNAGLY